RRKSFLKLPIRPVLKIKGLRKHFVVLIGVAEHLLESVLPLLTVKSRQVFKFSGRRAVLRDEIKKPERRNQLSLGRPRHGAHQTPVNPARHRNPKAIYEGTESLIGHIWWYEACFCLFLGHSYLRRPFVYSHRAYAGRYS